MTDRATTTTSVGSRRHDSACTADGCDGTNVHAADTVVATRDTRAINDSDGVVVMHLASGETAPDSKAAVAATNGDRRGEDGSSSSSSSVTTKPQPVALTEPTAEPLAYERKAKSQPPVARPDYRALLLDSKARHDATLRRGGDAHARKQHLLYAIDVFFLEHVWTKRDDWLRADECGMWLVTFKSGDDFWSQRFEREWCRPDPRLQWKPRRMWPQTPLPRGLEAVERVVGDTYRRMIVNAFIDRDEFGATSRTQFIVYLHLAFLDTRKSAVHVCDVSVPPESLWHRHMSGDFMTGFEPRMRALWAYEKRVYADARRVEACKELADEKRRHEADRVAATKRAAKRTAKKRAHRASVAGRRRDDDGAQTPTDGGQRATASSCDGGGAVLVASGESKRTRVVGGDGSDECDASFATEEKLGDGMWPTVLAVECCDRIGGDSKRTGSRSPSLPDR